jgi:5-methylcytosine-specific restriction endonuclease McrA
VLVKNNFHPMKVKTIAEKLQEEDNTINQRILRDEETYFKVTNPKPKTIEIKRGLDDAVFLRDMNRCYYCGKTWASSELKTRYLRPDVPDLDAWSNLITICRECTQKPSAELTPLVPPTKERKGIPFKAIKSTKSAWEYLVVRIRGVTRRQQDILLEQFLANKKETDEQPSQFYEFLEITNIMENVEERDWEYLENDQGRPSANLTQIFNYFGNKGWELVSMRDLAAPNTSGDELDEFDEFANYKVECIFKKRGGE